MKNDLYTNWKRSIYLLKSFYIQIVLRPLNKRLSILRTPFPLLFRLAPHPLSTAYLESFQIPLHCLLKTFLAHIFDPEMYYHQAVTIVIACSKYDRWNQIQTTSDIIPYSWQCPTKVSKFLKPILIVRTWFKYLFSLLFKSLYHYVIYLILFDHIESAA